MIAESEIKPFQIHIPALPAKEVGAFDRFQGYYP
jgi:hypothetical protein